MKPILLATAVIILAIAPAAAKDAVELTRECMIRHGAKRQLDGGVWLAGPREQTLAIRARCRKQSGYTGG